MAYPVPDGQTADTMPRDKNFTYEGKLYRVIGGWKAGPRGISCHTCVEVTGYTTRDIPSEAIEQAMNA